MEAFMGSYKEKEEEREENQDDDHEENLKTRISGHPLYGLLVETHLDCLKVTYISLSLSRSIDITLNSQLELVTYASFC